MRTGGRNPVLADATEWQNRHRWLNGVDVETERRQALDEGRELGPLAREFDALLAVPAPERGPFGGRRGAAWIARAEALADRVERAPFRRDYPFREPDDLAGILRQRPGAPRLRPWRGTRAAFVAKLHGGLLGRICGCMLGKPVEGWRRADIRATAEATGDWPLTGYFRAPTPAQRRRLQAAGVKRAFHGGSAACLRGAIRGAVEDDDLNYTTVGFALVKRFGRGFRPMDVGSFWLQHLPLLHTCTAERAAYRNLVEGVVPPASARRRNPYREWIGAQIRADYFGYANPGNPARATEWAWRDAAISHVRNGLYGEMWVAAMLAACYVEDDWLRVVKAGLAQIPRRCRLAQELARFVKLYADGADYDAAVAELHRSWDERTAHHWCHTISNAVVVLLGLLYGGDDYAKSVTRAVMPGFDTDCNGATVGSLWGVKHGVAALPRAWTAPMRDLCRTGVAGYHERAISRLAEDMAATALAQRG